MVLHVTGKQTRDEIVAAADRLFYERGFEATSFADIAAAVQISRGNFYYHFRTKDEILTAVIARRVAEREALLRRWAEELPPLDRVERFIGILIANQSKIMAYGCPVGTLATELAKLGHATRDDAAHLFTVFRDWLRCQVEALGVAERADDIALHLLMRSQGVATLATAYKDPEFIRREVEDMRAWLQQQLPDPSH